MASIGTLFGAPAAGTFLGVEAATPAAVPDGAIAVLGIPGATPYASAGAYCAAAPAAIRSAVSGYAANIAHHDFDLGGPLLPAGSTLIDAGDLAFDAADFTGNRARIRATMAEWIGRGIRPVVLGGDDSVQIPILAAFADAGPITVLQIDAHIDWRDEVQGERFGLSSTMRRASEMGGVKSIVQVGARAVGSARPGDVADAIAAGVQLFDMRKIRSDGLAPVIASIPKDRPVVVCLDVDGLDPSVVPAVIGRAPGGLGYGDIVELIAGVAARAPIAGFNIVELVPENDIGGQGALVAGRLAILGAGHAARSGSRAV
jgi:agmatinase